MASRAIPSHLKPEAAEGGGEGFAPRRHGKTQSHVVSKALILHLIEKHRHYTEATQSVPSMAPTMGLQPESSSRTALEPMLALLYSCGVGPTVLCPTTTLGGAWHTLAIYICDHVRTGPEGI